MNSDETVAARWYAENLQVHEAALRAWLRVKFPFLTDRDNVVQESLTRVWRMRQHDEIKSPKALLFTTARNLAIDELRRRNLAPIESLEELPDLSVLDEGAPAVDAVALKQEIELLIQAIQSLPVRCRQVLTLRKIYGLSHREHSRQTSYLRIHRRNPRVQRHPRVHQIPRPLRPPLNFSIYERTRFQVYAGGSHRGDGRPETGSPGATAG